MQNYNEKETQDRFAHIFFSSVKALGFAAMICDKDLKILRSDHKFAPLMDMSPDLFEAGRDALNILKHVEQRGDFGINSKSYHLQNDLAEISQATRAGILSSRSWVQKKSDGQVAEFTRIYTEDGLIVIIGRLITEMAHREKLLNLALASAEAGYWSYSFATDQFFFSDYLQDMMSEDEIRKTQRSGFWGILHPDDVQSTREAWEQAFRTNSPMDHTFRVVLDHYGERTLRNVGHPEFADNGRPIGVTCYLSDLTKMVQSQNALITAKAESEQALRSNREFLARMSHEIRTPMNGVLGMADALLQTADGQSIAKHLNVIKSSAENLLRVMNDTLEHAKLASGKMEIVKTPTSMSELLSALETLWTERAEQNGTRLTVIIDDSVPKHLCIDSFRTEQCLNNILSNAIKFTENGRISIFAKYIDRGDKSLLALAVQDTGIGMTPAQQGRVFGAFEQASTETHVKYGGAGLGMAIVKDLAELMGGRITFKSTPGKGSVFVLSLPVEKIEPRASIETETPLPLAQDVMPHFAEPKQSEYNHLQHNEDDESLTEPKCAEPAPQSVIMPAPEPERQTLAQSIFSDHAAQQPDFSALKILVAEDNKTNQIVVGALLEPLVGQTIFADNGQQAVTALDHHDIDIVLMDIHMPVMDGIEATLAIRTAKKPWSDVPIIALTADPEYQQLRICRNIGMDEAMAKPVSRAELMRAFTAVLKEQQSGPARRRA